jgi:hypothetical protein
MVDELVNEQNLLPPTVLPLWRKVMQHQTTDMSQQPSAPGSIAAFRADAIEVRVQASGWERKKKQRGRIDRVMQRRTLARAKQRQGRDYSRIDEDVDGTLKKKRRTCRLLGRQGRIQVGIVQQKRV